MTSMYCEFNMEFNGEQANVVMANDMPSNGVLDNDVVLSNDVPSNGVLDNDVVLSNDVMVNEV